MTDRSVSSSFKSGAAERASTITASELLAEHNKSLVGDLAHAFAYSALQSPLIAVAQLADGRAGGVAERSVTFMSAPKRQEFWSDKWLAQNVGSAAGMAVPFLILHKGVRSVSKLSVVGESATAGALFGGLLTPSAPDENFPVSRVRHAVTGGITMATLTASTIGAQGLGKRINQPTISGLLQGDVLPAVLSGVPAGIIGSNSESLLKNGKFADLRTQAESIITYATVGGVLSAVPAGRHENTAPPGRPSAKNDSSSCRHNENTATIPELTIEMFAPADRKLTTPAEPKKWENLDAVALGHVREVETIVGAEGPVLLTSVVGSRGRGTETPTSDWDIRSVYIQPATSFLKVQGVYKHSGGHKVGNVLDINSWELAHFLNLCLKGSPSTIEVLLSPKRMYTPAGAELAQMLPRMLERDAVFKSFDGFAKNEKDIMQNPNSGRNDKSASEYLRVLYTGAELLRTGTMSVDISNMPIRAEILAAKKGEMPRAEILKLGAELRADMKKACDQSVLPIKADLSPLNEFLMRMRRHHW